MASAARSHAQADEPLRRSAEAVWRDDSDIDVKTSTASGQTRKKVHSLVDRHAGDGL